MESNITIKRPADSTTQISIKKQKLVRESERRRSSTRVNIGNAFKAWRGLRLDLGIKTDSELAVALLDSYDQCTCARPNERRAPASHGTQDEVEEEGYCAVCQGTGELHCCDKCSRAFHLACHIPTLGVAPTNEWWCSLCRDLPPPAMEVAYNIKQEPGTEELKAGDQMRCERLLLDLYCNDLSTDFEKPDCPLDTYRYKQLITTPMDLSTVKRRLESSSPSEQRYVIPEEFVADVRLVFVNCLKYYRDTSKVGRAGMSLGNYFEEQLMLIYPGRTFPKLWGQPDALLQCEMKEDLQPKEELKPGGDSPLSF